MGTRRGIKAGWRAELITVATRHPRPTLILWGDRDRILPAHHLDAARRLIPHAQTRMFSGVGHMPLLGNLLQRMLKSTIRKGASARAIEAERRAGRVGF